MVDPTATDDPWVGTCAMTYSGNVTSTLASAGTSLSVNPNDVAAARAVLISPVKFGTWTVGCEVGDADFVGFAVGVALFVAEALGETVTPDGTFEGKGGNCLIGIPSNAPFM